MLNSKLLSSALLSLLFLTSTATSFAASGDISITATDVSYSDKYFLEGRSYKIYATASNLSPQDLLGVVRFYDNSGQIGGDQVISIVASRTDTVFVNWVPNFGAHKIEVKIFPFEPESDDPSNNSISSQIYVAQDTDHDGITNDKDDDDDGDGVIDTEDAFPLNSSEQHDADGDGIGDNSDSDSDNDGVPNDFDDLPLDPDETIDSDKDGIGNIADTDDDNDGLSDSQEVKIGTDTLIADTDNDGTEDKTDPFPLDPKEWLDTDKDNIGDNSDTDDDNDGIVDTADAYPKNKGPVIKLSTKEFKTNIYDEYKLNAAQSYDEDGEIINYTWKINDKEIREGNSLSYIFDQAGLQEVELIIIDDGGEERSYNFSVNVLNTNFYKQISAIFIAILLALIIYFKYIRVAKN